MISPKLKKYLNEKNTLSDHDIIHGHRNLNETKRSAIARYRNFNAPKICKIAVKRQNEGDSETRIEGEHHCSKLSHSNSENRQVPPFVIVELYDSK